MDITITPGKISGTVSVIPSKSLVHRYLICAALSDNETKLICHETNRDIQATVNCLIALGTDITVTESGYHIIPIHKVPEAAVLPCGESGSTLRFLLPVVGALGIDSVFLLEGSLLHRPLSPLWEEMERMGCKLNRPAPNAVHCCGKLKPGDYFIAGNISSQFISGLSFALPLISGRTTLSVTGKVESKPYVKMTQNVMKRFHAPHYHSPGNITVEGDWSNGAFWLSATALGNDITVENLDPSSTQGDRSIAELLPKLSKYCVISAADIPDLVPILSVVAACRSGAAFTEIQRLRLKESDRVETVISMIENLGGKAEVTEDTLTVYGTGLRGGIVDCSNDHRIAMSAAIAATVCSAPVTITGAHCVEKSYPRFFDEYRRLGGIYEQYLR